jgi:excinuclease ABC subunit C
VPILPPQPECNFDSKALLKTLPHQPGVYRMVGSSEQILYIGKAKDLKNRVASYFRGSSTNSRIWSMVKQVCEVRVTLTATEAEALLLESNLIKKHQPRYNILLRDDKGYPYLHLSTQQPFPRICLHRGGRKKQGQYFGPYPSAGAVRETLYLLQKIFKVRQCEDSYYANRSRPCLQYQIKRCTAPCTGEVTEDIYQQQVKQTVQFLQGKNQQLINDLVLQMDDLSTQLKFEQAAEVRDKIQSLRQVTQQQHIIGGKGNMDIMAIQFASEVASIQVHTIRDGHNLGNRNYFPKVPKILHTKGDILASFIAQYYVNKEIPSEILLNYQPDQAELLVDMLRLKSENQVRLSYRLRGDRARRVAIASKNAQHALTIHLLSKTGMQQRLSALQEVLGLAYSPTRMECFDISHTQGEATVASCVVFGEEGANKAEYRRYNIEGITAGDDYAAMRQVIYRRFAKVIETNAKLPDILFIDGGKGQVSQATKMLAELQIANVDIVGIVKGEGRKAAFDNLIIDNRRIVLPAHSGALHLAQQIRDEAHRFAITGHRQKRQKARTTSALEQITGLGPKRRQCLLKQFGGIRAVSRASVDEMEKVSGISRKLAQKVYDMFNVKD